METIEQTNTTNPLKEFIPYFAGALALGAAFLLSERLMAKRNLVRSTGLGANTPLPKKWGDENSVTGRRDIVDEASIESFPASDAPAW